MKPVAPVTQTVTTSADAALFERSYTARGTVTNADSPPPPYFRPPGHARARGPAEASTYVPGEVIVGYKDGARSATGTRREGSGSSRARGGRPDARSCARPERRVRRAELRRPRVAVHARRPLPAPPVELHRHATGSACRRRGRWPPRPARPAAGRHGGGARQRRRVRALPRLPARARPAPLHVRAPLGLRRPRPPPQRPLRARHPRDRHDRRGHQQRPGRRGRGLRREDHAAQGAQRLRRGRLRRDRAGRSATRPSTAPT